MSKVKESNCFMYSEGSVFVIVIILAETNINGALIKVQATIALAIYKSGQCNQLLKIIFPY